MHADAAASSPVKLTEGRERRMSFDGPSQILRATTNAMLHDTSSDSMKAKNSMSLRDIKEKYEYTPHQK